MKTDSSSGGLLDVLNGNKSIKVDVGIDTLSLVILGVTIMVAVALAVIIAKKIA